MRKATFYIRKADELEPGMSTADGQDIVDVDVDATSGWVIYHTVTPGTEGEDARMARIGEYVDLADFNGRDDVLDDMVTRRLGYRKKRTDFTIDKVEVLPLLHGFRIGDPEGWGDLSLQVTYRFATSPDRVRVTRWNLYLRDFPPAFFDFINTALAGGTTGQDDEDDDEELDATAAKEDRRNAYAAGEEYDHSRAKEDRRNAGVQ